MCAAKSQMFFCEREWNIQSAKNSAQDTLINRKTACWQTGVFVVKWQKHIMQGQWRKIRSFWKLQRAGGWCEPVRKNEAVWFPSRFCEQPSGSVMKPGFPRYRDRTCWSLKRLPFGSNQGGTTDFYSSLRLLWPQGLFLFCLREESSFCAMSESFTSTLHHENSTIHKVFWNFHGLIWSKIFYSYHQKMILNVRDSNLITCLKP